MKALIFFWKARSLFGKLAILLLVALMMMAIFAPALTNLPHQRSSGPALEPPGWPHIMGTDQLGIDIWSMIVHGARTSLLVGLGTSLLAGLGGGIIGIMAAWKGGVMDRYIQRLIDIMLALPELPAMIVIAAFFGSSLKNIIIVLALFSWSRPARILRAATLSLREQPYIKMASHYGGKAPYMIWKHLIPELFPLLMINMIRLASMAIVTESSLAFLGLGDPASRSWGLIIHHAVNFQGIFMTPFWKWWLLFPWLFLTLLVTSLALLGRDLESMADPRMLR
ncbi:peptide/nickel transport system permease protein [Tindallia magadiensis]|uniref:Peptide/nickel transport system permease protein n=1 Tax=Tindallia magadiensis TaxID=69895 RepID=A0A1I3BC44_9FIRM|nr:ABC transporter permease [Tindallia magadiensis]SFH59863.1 peptide/nickel transport system permease protein [Tindallia magadiensis]